MAKKLRIRPHVRPAAVMFLLWAIVVFIAIDVLAKWNIIDVSTYISPIFIPTVASFFILLDVGVFQRKRGKIDAVEWFTIVMAGLALFGVVLHILGTSAAFLTSAQGFVGVFLLISVVVNILKKN